MNIEKHIKNLEEYCQDDDLFEKDGDFKEFCDNHIADIKAVIQELKNTQADLYEANNRIADLLDIVKQKDKIINEMADYIKEPYKSVYLPQIFKARMGKREAIKKYFEERCKNAKD